MRKLFLHVLIACTMFYFGVTLSTVVKFLSTVLTTSDTPTLNTSDPAVDQQQEQPRLGYPNLDGSDELALWKIFDQYGPAQTKHDRAFFERVESDQFILFRPAGTLTREEDIREMMSWPMGITYTWDIESIQVLGDSAVVIGRLQSRFSDGSNSWRFINVCVKNGDGWQILSTTSTE